MDLQSWIAFEENDWTPSISPASCSQVLGVLAVRYQGRSCWPKKRRQLQRVEKPTIRSGEVRRERHHALAGLVGGHRSETTTKAAVVWRTVVALSGLRWIR